MSELSVFESRKGIVSYSAGVIYDFASDIRNFEQFIPAGAVTGFIAESDSCTFQVGMLGTVNVRIAEKNRPGKVLFSGSALQVNEFSMNLTISESIDGSSEVKVVLAAAMNPFLKMVASEPVKQFLETLIKEMEKFRGWDMTKTHN
jgi:carbon monoxide dehydrogenase subunit G